MQLPFGCSRHTEADAGFEATATRSMQAVTSKTAAVTNVPVMLHLDILVALLSPGLILLDSTHSHQIAIFVAVATTLNTLTRDRLQSDSRNIIYRTAAGEPEDILQAIRDLHRLTTSDVESWKVAWLYVLQNRVSWFSHFVAMRCCGVMVFVHGQLSLDST